MDASDFPLTSEHDVDLTVLAEVHSTNAYLHDHPGVPGRVAVVVTNNQTHGRGRQGRPWSLPPGSGLAISVSLPVEAEGSRLQVFPLVVGAVVCDVITAETGVAASVKWPNDILVAGKKVAGILCETRDGSVIAGIGVNLAYPKDSLPTPHATSLHLHTVIEATLPDRLLAGIVTGLREATDALAAGRQALLLEGVAGKLATIGQQVQVDFPDGSSRRGTATGIGPDGSLQLLWTDGTQGVVVAGDVWHLTPLT